MVPLGPQRRCPLALLFDELSRLLLSIVHQFASSGVHEFLVCDAWSIERIFRLICLELSQGDGA